MRTMIQTSQRLRLALLVGAGIMLSVVVAGMGWAQASRQDTPAYRSSIQVPRSEGAEEAEEGAGEDDRDSDSEGSVEREGRDEDSDSAEKTESQKYSALARITPEQARAAALTRVPGTVASTILENEDGNLVYSVVIRTKAGNRDVKVDAGNNNVLHVEADDRD